MTKPIALLPMAYVRPSSCEARVLIGCEVCGLTARYIDAYGLGWKAVKRRPFHFRCCGHIPEKN